ncbi:MAG: hypothetical protein LBV61_11065, partial [Burkholderiaceae bacterium]|nr:hypothetical protein [Burkholderiaceae bacterium]
MKPAASIATLISGAILALSAHATCETGLAERFSAKLHPDAPLDHALAVCEPWRGVRDHTIVVLPLPHQAVSGLHVYDLDVLVVQRPDNGNSDRDRIVSRFLDHDALIEGQNHVTAIRLESTRYRLAHNAYAFGLRVLWRNNDDTAPASSEQLSLYLPSGRRLIKVLDGLELDTKHSSPSGNANDNCAARLFTHQRSQLSVAPTSTHGLADLALQRSQWITASPAQDPDSGTCPDPAPPPEQPAKSSQDT